MKQLTVTNDGDRGAIAVFTALVTVVLVALGTLTVDLGLSYADRRQGQNASDAAAMAATNQLIAARWTVPAGAATFVVNNTEAAKVEAVAQVTLEENGALLDDYDCEVVDPDGSAIAACSATSTWLAAPNAVGVRVVGRTTREPVLAGASAALLGRDGPDELGTVTRAAARVSPAQAGYASFLVCVKEPRDGRGAPSSSIQPDLMVLNAGTWQVNPSAIGENYNIHGPRVGQNTQPATSCENGDASFKGLADPDQLLDLPQWVGTNTGTRAGPTRSEVAGSCGDPEVVGCQIIAPLCVESRGSGANTELNCVAWGTFEIVTTWSNAIEAEFIGAATVVGATPTGGVPQANQPRVITLVE